jgi:hypothetical protein
MKHQRRLIQRRDFLRNTAFALGSAALPFPVAAADPPSRTAPQLRLSKNRRYLIDDNGKPFFLLGDTPWFLQYHQIDDVKWILEDRLQKGFNTLFLELLDDSRMPSKDGYGNVAFAPEKDITKPVEAYWKYAEQVLDEVTKRGFYVILSELWYGFGKGLWMHHVTPENARVYGAFIGKRFARFRNVTWMHAGDRNPDKRLAECTRTLAKQIQAAAPHQLHTVHNQPEFASAAFHHEDPWLDINLCYTYGAAHRHVLPEYQRKNPVHPIILGETGYEDEPNDIERLPDAKKGELWTPYRIRRNVWWAITSGAVGYCAGSRLWRWEKNWKDVLNVRSTKEAPHVLALMQKIDWWKLVPDAKHEFLTAGYGDPKKADYVTAARAEDGSCGLVYLPRSRPVTVRVNQLANKVAAAWFDPTTAVTKPATGRRVGEGQEEFTPPERNAAEEPDWVLVFRQRA